MIKSQEFNFVYEFMRVLLVEDDLLLGDALENGLRQVGFNVDWMKDGVEAQTAMSVASYDAVVLDLGLPRVSGIEVLNYWRSNSITVPVLVLTARDGIDDPEKCLNAGADDYMVKIPNQIKIKELVARIRALIRRSHGRATPVLEHADVVLNPQTHKVLKAGREVELTAREFQLVELFMENKDRVLPRALLEEKLYGWVQDLDSNALEVHIHHVRKKLGANFIRTLRSVGYQLGDAEKIVGKT